MCDSSVSLDVSQAAASSTLITSIDFIAAAKCRLFLKVSCVIVLIFRLCFPFIERVYQLLLRFSRSRYRPLWCRWEQRFGGSRTEVGTFENHVRVSEKVRVCQKWGRWGRWWPGGDTEARLRIRQVFASLLAGLCKSTLPIFVKFGGKVARGPRKKPLNFAGNPGLHPDLGSF